MVCRCSLFNSVLSSIEGLTGTEFAAQQTQSHPINDNNDQGIKGGYNVVNVLTRPKHTLAED